MTLIQRAQAIEGTNFVILISVACLWDETLYILVLTHVCVSGCVHIHSTCIYMHWGRGTTLGVIFKNIGHLLWCRVFLDPERTIRLHWLSSKAQASSWLWFFPAGMTACTTTPGILTWVLGTKLKSSCSQRKLYLLSGIPSHWLEYIIHCMWYIYIYIK